jgi:hypothetical protein
LYIVYAIFVGGVGVELPIGHFDLYMYGLSKSKTEIASMMSITDAEEFK